MPDEVAVSRKEQAQAESMEEDTLVVESEDEDWVEDDEGNFVKKGE